MSSFQKRKQQNGIAGSRPSLYNGQLIVSSGNPSLDCILGGGLQIGSMILIEEDKYVTYSKSILKYFLAEGVVHRHPMFLISLDEEPDDLIKKIPIPSSDTVRTKVPSSTLENDEMRIAWRYNDLPKVDAEQSSNVGHHFDLTRTIDEQTIKELDISYFTEDSIQDCIVGSALFSNIIFAKILTAIKERLATLNLPDSTERKLLRLCFHSLGSPLWYSEKYSRDICLFLSCVKALIRNNVAVCLITMPVHLLDQYDEHLINRIRNQFDYSVELESFAGSDKETNPIFKEYNGLFHIHRSIALNTLAAFTPETHDLAFKLRRKKFVIEKLHLPPELQESDNQSTAIGAVIPPSTSSCGGGPKKNLLEF